MDSLNVILIVLEDSVLLEPALVQELLVPIAQISWYTCSSANSNLLFTMDFKGFFTMNFLQNLLTIILKELVPLMLDLMRELVILVSQKVQICVCSTVDSKLLFTMDFEGFFTMDFMQSSLDLILGKLIYLMLDLTRELVILVSHEF